MRRMFDPRWWIRGRGLPDDDVKVEKPAKPEPTRHAVPWGELITWLFVLGFAFLALAYCAGWLR